MRDLLPITKLLYCSWLLSGQTSIPTTPGVLDAALQKVLQSGAFPEWMQKELHFVNSNMGLICEELPYIQKLATQAKITSDPNPSYTTSEIVVGELYASRALGKLDITEDQAIDWGNQLKSATDEVLKELELLHA